MSRKHGTKWLGDVTYNGKRERKVFNTQAEADAFEKNPASFFREKVTIEQSFTAAWEFRYRRSKNAKDTRTAYLEFIRMLGPARDPETITSADMFGMVDQWRAKGLTDKRINRKLSYLRKIIEYCVQRNYMSHTPNIKGFKEYKGRVRFLSVDEELRIRSHFANDVYRRFFDFLIDTGCRYGEAKALQWKDVHDNNTVSLWGIKGNTNRTIPLTKKARQALDAVADNAGGPWASIEYNSWHDAFTRAATRAGFGDDDQVVGHVLRHTCASRLVQRGVDIRRVKEWMGHADISTTMGYAHLAPNDLLAVVDVLEPESVRQSVRETQPADEPINESAPLPNVVPFVPRDIEDKEQSQAANVMERLGFS